MTDSRSGDQTVPTEEDRGSRRRNQWFATQYETVVGADAGAGGDGSGSGSGQGPGGGRRGRGRSAAVLAGVTVLVVLMAWVIGSAVSGNHGKPTAGATTATAGQAADSGRLVQLSSAPDASAATSTQSSATPAATSPKAQASASTAAANPPSTTPAASQAPNAAKGSAVATATSVAAVPPIVYQALPGTWSKCATENATCSFGGTAVVAFGAYGRFNYSTASGSISCNIGTFGDPIYGYAKSCFVETAAPTADLWSGCAAEGGTCSFYGIMTVAFGANGHYNYASLGSGGTACTVSVFGDPLYMAAKSCFLMAPPPSFTTWTACAAENGACAFSGTREVAFGSDGQYFYRTVSGGITCSIAVFGDPNYGATKGCYMQ